MKLSLLHQYLGHRSSIYDLVYWKKKDLVLSTGGDGWIVTWDVLAGEGDGKLFAKTDEQNFCMAIDDQSQLLFVGGMSGHLYVVDLNEKVVLKKLSFHKKSIFNLLVVADMLYSVSGDGVLCQWKISTLLPTQSIQLSAYGLRSIAIKGDSLYVGGSDKHIYHVEIDTFTRKDIWKNIHGSSIFAMLLDGDRLISGGRDAKLCVTNIHTQESSLIDAHWYTINDLVMIDQILISVSRDKKIRCWDKDTLKLRSSISAKEEGHINSVNSIIRIPNYEIVVSAGDDRSLRSYKW